LVVDFLDLIGYGEDPEKLSNLDEDVDKEVFVNSCFQDLD
jgi:hypothetical protein